MAENTILFRDNQETQADDFNNMQDWIGQSIDDIVGDAINPGNAYVGLAISQTAQTQITIQPGRLYWGGEVFVVATPTVLDFYNNLPVTQNRQVAVVAWGQTVQTDVQPRNFIINADTGQSQPQSVAMEQSRVLNLSSVPGVEAPSPENPPVSATTLLIGYILLGPSGIISFQQVTDTQLDNLSDLGDRTTALENFEAQVEGQVNTLSTALSALAGQLANYVTVIDYSRLVTLVNAMYAKLMQPAAFIWYGADNFLDATLSQTAGNVDGAYNAIINEGLRFNAGNTGSTTLQLLNPSDPSVLIGTDGFILPKPSGSRVRMDCSFTNLSWIEDRVLLYAYATFSQRVLGRSRHRHCCGPHFTPCPQAQVWWYQAQLDPTTHILSFDAETWESVEWAEISRHPENSVDWPQHQWERYKYFWHDCVDLPYWSKVNTPSSQTGNYVMQSFLNAQDGWLTGVSLYATQSYYQPITLQVLACDTTGKPDLTQVLATVTLSGSQLQACFGAPFHQGDLDVASAWWTNAKDPRCPVNIHHVRIPIPPTFLQAGGRYALHVLSTYDHRFAISDQYNCFAVHQGAYWVAAAGGLQQWTTGTRSLRFQLHYAVWQQWQGGGTSTAPGPCTVNLQGLQLSGGINSLQILAESIVPNATTLTYNVQIGGTWMPFNADPNSPTLSSNPALLPINVTFTGTTDMMPGLSMTNSQVKMMGPIKTAFHHIADAITLGSTATAIKVVATVNDFNSAHHALTASLHYGATHDTTFTAVDTILDDGTLQRAWTFGSISITSSVPFVVELDGTQDGTGDPFHVGQRIAYAEA